MLGTPAFKLTSPTGDVVFECKASAKEVKAELEARLFAYARKPIGVVVPTTSEMAAVAKARFPRRNATAPSQSSSMKPPPPDALDHVVGKNDEEMRLGAHEIFVSYGSGMGKLKLRIPAAKTHTAPNIKPLFRDDV